MKQGVVYVCVLGGCLFIFGLPKWLSGKSTCQCRRHKRSRFDPWVRKTPWRRKWQPTPVLLPGESHGQRSLVGYSPWVEKRHDWVSTHTYPLFLLFIVSFTMQNLLSLSKSHLFLFPLFWEEKGLLRFVSERVLLMFSTRSFIVSSLPFRSLIHFELIFVYGVKRMVNFTFLHVIVWFPQYRLLKKLFPSLMYTCLLCHRLFDHRCMA